MNMRQLQLSGQVIEIRSDGFFNATQMCKAGGRAFAQWHCLSGTKELINAIKDNLRNKDMYSSSQDPMVVDKKKGGKPKSQGTWIHPDLVVHLAQWISPAFKIHVSEWISEWVEASPANKDKFQIALSELKPSKRTMQEREIQSRLHLQLGGSIEVPTMAGFIDLLTTDRIIEIKEISNWKCAIGQVLSYAVSYPDYLKCIYLFGNMRVNRYVISKICSAYDITAVFLDM
jgi:hypothetical protein